MKQSYNRWLAKWRLGRRYRYLIEVDKLLEEYITERILSGSNPEIINKARQDLVQKQNEIAESKKFLEFLSR